MSGWDAPTGNWDSGDEPEAPGSDDQGYQQTQSTGAHRATRGESILRAGRRGLPGYDQAQNYDQPGGYDQPTMAYGQGTRAQNAQPPQEPSVFRRAIGSGSPSAEPYDRGSTGAYPSYGAQEQSPMAWSGVDDQGYGTQAHGQQDPGASQDFGTQGFGIPAYGRQDSGQNGQGYQNEAAYPQQGFEPSGYAQGGYADQGHADQGHSDPGHADQGYTSSGYSQNDYGQAPDAYQQDGHGQGAYDGYSQNGGQGSYPQDGYGQGGYSPDAYRQDTYGQGGYGQGGYAQDAYGQEAYGQPGFERPSGPAYGDEEFNAPGAPPRAAQPRSGQRSPQRLSGIRMILYLVASVLGVVLIVLLVVHLTKSGSNNPTAGSTTSPTAGTGGTTGSGFVFTRAAKAGTLPLNAAATRDFSQFAQKEAGPEAQAIKARGAGNPGKQVIAMYDLGHVTNVNSSNFRAVGFVGYGGTFNPTAVIEYMKTRLVSTRIVSPGPHGGEMICGYNTAEGSDASECVWVTATTFGQVHFVKGTALVKYPGASKIALEVRNAVEVKAG
jgi:hypothetical protein